MRETMEGEASRQNGRQPRFEMHSLENGASSALPVRGLRPGDLATVEAKVTVGSITAEIHKLHLARPISHKIHTGKGYWIDMSLTGRTGEPRVRYTDRWNSHRLEKVGSIMALVGREPIHGVSGPGTGKSVVCRIAPDAAFRWLGHDQDWSDEQLVSMLDMTGEAVKSCMTRLAMELRNPGFASHMMIELIAGELMIELHRSMRTAERPFNGGLAPWQLKLVLERLNDQILDVSLKDVAALCGISVRHLTRAFRASQGCSIGSFLARTRMERAKSGLIAGESIKMLAPRLGFASASSFTSAFRRDVGISPAAFRASFK